MDATTTLSLTRVTKDVGATVKPGPMIVAEPDRVVTEPEMQNVAAGSGLNGPFLADLVVSMAAHENMAVDMYRVLRTYTSNPALQGAYKAFENDSLEAVAAHVQLMTELGIPMYYISPAARMTENLDNHMIMSFLGAGSADPLTCDLKTVEAVLLGATMCVANTRLLEQIGQAADGDARDAIGRAVATLQGPQLEHLTWAEQTQQKMVLTMVQHPATQKLTRFAEDVIGKLRQAMH
jgi:hypothetical protein